MQFPVNHVASRSERELEHSIVSRARASVCRHERWRRGPCSPVLMVVDMVASLQRELDNARVSSVRSYCSSSYKTAMTSSPFMGLISIIELS